MPSSHPTTNAEDQAFYKSTLQDLITIGTQLAHQVHQAAQPTPNQPGQPAPMPLEAATIAFDRITRAVRRTILLARHLARRKPTPDTTATRRRVIRRIEDIIARAPRPAPEAEALHAELIDRLDRPETDEDLRTRPFNDIIMEIARDLGLIGAPGEYPRRTPAHLAELHRKAARHHGAPASSPPQPGRRFSG